MKRKLPEKFFEQNQRAKTRKWKFFNLNQALWGAGNREFRFLLGYGRFYPRRSSVVLIPRIHKIGSAQDILVQLPFKLSLSFRY